MRLNDQHHPGGVSCEERLGPIVDVANVGAKMHLRLAARQALELNLCPRCAVVELFCAVFEVALENGTLDKEAVFDMAMNGLAKMTQRITEREEAAKAAATVP